MLLTPTCDGVAIKPLFIGIQHSKTSGQIAAHRHVQHALIRGAVGARTIFDTIAELESVDRLPCGDQHRARIGVLSEQRALRTAQDFHTTDVEEGSPELPFPARIDSVDEQADRRIEPEVEPGGESADRNAGLFTALDHVQAGSVTRKFIEVGYAEFLDRLAGDHADSDRNVHQNVRPLCRGDDDLGQALAFAGPDRLACGRRGLVLRHGSPRIHRPRGGTEGQRAHATRN